MQAHPGPGKFGHDSKRLDANLSIEEFGGVWAGGPELFPVAPRPDDVAAVDLLVQIFATLDSQPGEKLCPSSGLRGPGSQPQRSARLPRPIGLHEAVPRRARGTCQLGSRARSRSPIARAEPLSQSAPPRPESRSRRCAGPVADRSCESTPTVVHGRARCSGIGRDRRPAPRSGISQSRVPIDRLENHRFEIFWKTRLERSGSARQGGGQHRRRGEAAHGFRQLDRARERHRLEQSHTHRKHIAADLVDHPGTQQFFGAHVWKRSHPRRRLRGREVVEVGARPKSDR